MSEEFQRLGAARGVLVVVVAAIVAVAGLSSSGLSVAAPEHAVATVRPEVPPPVATTPGATTARSAAAGHRRRKRTAQRRKHCRPVDGVTFTVSVGQRCPKPLKHAGSGPHLSAKLRRAASRPRPVLVAPGKPAAATPAKPPVATTTAKQPAAATTPKARTPPAKKPSTGAAGAGVKSTNGAAEAPNTGGAGAR
jgi:hypothetical protein